MSRRSTFRFRLYVARDAPNSAQAISNLGVFCREYLKDRSAIEVVDVFKAPERALLEKVFMTPTLIVLAPLPVRRVVGALSNAQTLRWVLGLEPTTA